MTITVVPLGTPETMTIAAWETIRGARQLFLQTAQHPSARPVLEAAISFISMDDLYASAKSFSDLNERIAERLVAAGDCVYAISGASVRSQLPVIREHAAKAAAAVCVLPGVPLHAAAFPEISGSGSVYAAVDLPECLQPQELLFVEELDTPITAGIVKLKLMEYYPDDWAILFASMKPDGGYDVRKIPLYALDRQKHYHAATVAAIPPAPLLKRKRFGYDDLLDVLTLLRGQDGCPWDREQTHSSLKKDLLEECYELVDAIDRQDDDAICEETGDVLMQAAFHAVIGAEQCAFTPRDVTTELVAKLIYRHPHVFGDGQAATTGEVLANWEKLKKIEKKQETTADTLYSVPKAFPALMRARKVQKRAAAVGFDWENAESAFFKIGEETCELREAIERNGNIVEEAGDLLFAAVNVIRLLKLDPEFVLTAATDKFVNRFARMERLAMENGNQLSNMTLTEMDALWDKAKKDR